MNLDSKNNKLLIIGCKPWDNNILEVQGLEYAHFIDYYIGDAPAIILETFHHIDVNDVGIYSHMTENPAGKLSEFTNIYAEYFNTIIIDWATYQHFNRDSAWTDFAKLLKNDGKLVIPIISCNIMTNESNALEKAYILSDKLHNFNGIDLYNYENMPTLPSNLLTCDRLGNSDEMIKMNPIIIFATK